MNISGSPYGRKNVGLLNVKTEITEKKNYSELMLPSGSIKCVA